jgi:hypothetical protein
LINPASLYGLGNSIIHIGLVNDDDDYQMINRHEIYPLVTGFDALPDA